MAEEVSSDVKAEVVAESQPVTDDDQKLLNSKAFTESVETEIQGEDDALIRCASQTSASASDSFITTSTAPQVEIAEAATPEVETSEFNAVEGAAKEEVK